jgi:hypothetical protein
MNERYEDMSLYELSEKALALIEELQVLFIKMFSDKG